MSKYDGLRDIPVTRLQEMAAQVAVVDAESAWPQARQARKNAVASLQKLADLPLSRDQARRCAGQVARLRDELAALETRFHAMEGSE